MCAESLGTTSMGNYTNKKTSTKKIRNFPLSHTTVQLRKPRKK